jgi:hypothetical protein
VRIDSGPSGCDVIGCDDSATGVYLDARDSTLLEFGVCVAHHARLQAGKRPVVIADPLDDVGGDRPALILE